MDPNTNKRAKRDPKDGGGHFGYRLWWDPLGKGTKEKVGGGAPMGRWWRLSWFYVVSGSCVAHHCGQTLVGIYKEKQIIIIIFC